MPAALKRPIRKITSLPRQTGTRELTGRSTRGNTRATGVITRRTDATSQFAELTTKRDISNQIPDPFEDFYGFGNGNNILLTPPYNFDALVRVGMANSTLSQCIESYIVNIESYGYVLEYTGLPGKEQTQWAQAEKRKAMAFLDSPSSENSLRDIREKTRKDYEFIGNKYYEIMRNVRNEIVAFDHVPGTTMRVTRVDSYPTNYTGYVRDADNGMAWKKVTLQKYFRRFVQLSATGRRVYFKEFGDPRPIDPATGLVNPELGPEDQATEIYHKPIYTPGNPYGVPRWIGALPAVLGTRESEIVNLNFFRENAIPAMVVLVSGGALTAESFDNITSVIRAKRGPDAMQRVLVLEAAADDASGAVDGSSPAPKIDMKPMTSERQSDGTFQNYEKAGADKIKSTMRLPAIYVGDSQEYTKATAQAGKELAEGQVFAPERSYFDEFINYKVFPTINITQWRFKTMGPTTYDPDTLSNFIDKFNKAGAMTPNLLIRLANEVLDIQIAPSPEPWADIPFPIVMDAIQFGYEVKGLDKYITLIQQAVPEPDTPQADTSKPGDPQPDKSKPTTTSDGKKIKTPKGVEELRLIRATVRKEIRQVMNDMLETRQVA